MLLPGLVCGERWSCSTFGGLYAEQINIMTGTFKDNCGTILDIL